MEHDEILESLEEEFLKRKLTVSSPVKAACLVAIKAVLARFASADTPAVGTPVKSVPGPVSVSVYDEPIGKPHTHLIVGTVKPDHDQGEARLRVIKNREPLDGQAPRSFDMTPGNPLRFVEEIREKYIGTRLGVPRKLPGDPIELLGLNFMLQGQRLDDAARERLLQEIEKMKNSPVNHKLEVIEDILDDTMILLPADGDPKGAVKAVFGIDPGKNGHAIYDPTRDH